MTLHNCRGGTGAQPGKAADCGTCQAYEQAGVDQRQRPQPREVSIMAAFLESEAERWGVGLGHSAILAECARKLRAYRPTSPPLEVPK